MDAAEGAVYRKDRGSGVPDHMSTWIELFYDLIFVAAILILSAAVQHVHPSDGVVWIVLVFGATWWVWFTTTVCANRFHMGDLPHRLILVFQMLVIVLIAAEARASVTGDSTYLALEYGLLLAGVGFMYLRAARVAESSDKVIALRLAILNAASAVLFFVAVLLPEAGRLVVCGVGLVLLVALTIAMLRGLNDFSTADERHLVERMGAFTLIVCGESFVEIAISVSGATFDSVDVVSLVFEFVLVFGLFTSYFEDIPAAGVNQRRFGWWASLHLVAQICIAGTAVVASKLVDLRISHRLPDIEILKLTATLAILYLALGGICACTRRRPVGQLAQARVITAAVLVVVGLAAWWIPWIHMAEALPIFALVVLLHTFVAARLVARTRLIDAAALDAQSL